MKKIFAILICASVVLSLAACGVITEKPENSNDDISTEASKPANNESKPDNSQTTEKCYVCLDVDAPIDRKCDKCGNWVYPDGEGWTSEIPANLKMLITTSSGDYNVVEKIGDEYFIKQWFSKASYDENGTRFENYATIDKSYDRTGSDDTMNEWKETSYKTTYGDKAELFARKAMGRLSGSSISQTVSNCKETSSIGTETVAGLECQMYEFTGNFGTEYKVWLCGNMPIKELYKDQSMDEFKVLYEILEWDTSITEFSEEMPK